MITLVFLANGPLLCSLDLPYVGCAKLCLLFGRDWLFSRPRPGAQIVQKYKEDVNAGRHQKIEEKIKVQSRESKGIEVLKEGDIKVDNVYSREPTCPIYEAVP